ncbi:Uncharacterised protein [Brevibacillus brevis]|nr:hypothetical protein FB479_10954 [Brevibacillus sp. AG162]VEF91229.1 Uncharacterised protein [Brevibacillus brevis]
MFRFLHSVSVGVPKIFAYFSCFLYELSLLERVLKDFKRIKNAISYAREEYFQT